MAGLSSWGSKEKQDLVKIHPEREWTKEVSMLSTSELVTIGMASSPI